MTFASPRAVTSSCERQIQSSISINKLASGPLTPTFANVPTQVECECWRRTTSPPSRRIHPFLTSIHDEICGTVAGLFAYAGTLALLGILALYGWRQLPLADLLQGAAEPGWTVTSRLLPAFAVAFDQDRSRTYTILRHPEGGRKDVFRWPAQAEAAKIELEIYRIGAEAGPAADAFTYLAERMPADRTGGLESAGMIESKFGPVALFHRAGASDGFGACLGFVKRIDDPVLQLTGWSCQG
ncbi:hypothetical protein, partial [Bradyrhizobium sp.]|uniref:hypothetical protein n=1 Tax=Bradyrhizobium sp. TaxID=376 RepID=UPI0025C5563B